MSQVNQHNVTFGSLASSSAPITNLPTEVLVEIFKIYVESYPEVLDQRVVDLCLVKRYWNAVANDTPQLWTKINISFPFADNHIAAVLKRVCASGLQKIDVSIDFRDPNWDGDEDELRFIPKELVWARHVIPVLEGTEKRWKSIKVISDMWLPLYELLDHWRFTHLPSLESISMKRNNVIFGMRNVPFDPQLLIEPKTLFGRGASLPNLREVSLSAVHVDWNDASVGCQNLRKLELTSLTYDVGPSFEQFAAILSSSPRLEYLDVSGLCPEHHTGPGILPEIPVVHLPALKEFIFGWKDVDLGCGFLQMFQVGDSLENLTLLDTESGFGCWMDPQTKGRSWAQESQGIFEALSELGSAAPWDSGDTPSGPFISMRGVKRLKIAWTKATHRPLDSFLMMLTGLEDIRLEDVDRDVLGAVARIGASSTAGNQAFGRLDLRWTWQEGVPSFAEEHILRLEGVGIKSTVQGAEGW